MGIDENKTKITSILQEVLNMKKNILVIYRVPQ